MPPLPDTFTFKRAPRSYQQEVLLDSWQKPSYGLLIEQRCGKTKIVLDTAAALYQDNKIKNLIIVAPMGIHSDWVNIHAKDDVSIPWYGFTWRSNKAKTREATKRLCAFLARHDRLRIFSLNDEAVMVNGCIGALRILLKEPSMVVFDESDEYAANYRPKAKRLKVLIKLAMAGKYRRILTGTPASEGPLDIYGQLRLLEEHPLNFNTWWEFRAYYAEWEQAYAAGKSHTFQRLKGYRNLEDLRRRLTRVSVRIRRADCADLPAKQLGRRSFGLSPEYREVYDQMRNALRTGMDEPSPLPMAARILTGIMRLQQISSGFLPKFEKLIICPDCGGVGGACPTCDGAGTVNSRQPQGMILEGENNRLNALYHELYKEPAFLRSGPGNKVIVWARFHHDINTLMTNIPEEWNAVRYDGTMAQEDREHSRHCFQNVPACRMIVGNPQSGGRGVDLSAADLVIYYSHHWSLRMREQSEDRAVSLAKKIGIGYVDLVADDTIDDDIVEALHNKRELSTLVTGDPKPERWFNVISDNTRSDIDG